YLTRIAPAPSSSRSKSGISSLSARCPPISRACAWRDCGVPGRWLASFGILSRSSTSTCSKNGASAAAADSPPMLAPTTMAWRPTMVLAIVPPLQGLAPASATYGEAGPSHKLRVGKEGDASASRCLAARPCLRIEPADPHLAGDLDAADVHPHARQL